MVYSDGPPWGHNNQTERSEGITGHTKRKKSLPLIPFSSALSPSNSCSSSLTKGKEEETMPMVVTIIGGINNNDVNGPTIF